jgi:MFS family permease
MFGLVIALPYISLIITSPIGGIIADRLRKQRIMFWLDATTTIIIVLYMIASGFIMAAVPLVIVKLMALNAIQGMYMPTVQAAVPSLVPTKKLVPANSITTMINMFSSMAGMAVAGILYERFGLYPILIVSAICFAITAVMDLLIRIPYKKPESTGSITKIVKSDLSQSTKFMAKEKPIIATCAFIAFFVQLTVVPMVIVGVPVLVTRYLDFGMDFVGYSQSIMMVGGLAGGIVAGTIGAKLTINKLPVALFIGCLLFGMIGIPFVTPMTAMSSYVFITIATALAMLVIQMVNIPLFAYVQAQTPSDLIGKVMSLFMILPFVASSVGSLIYGVLFEQFEAIPWVVIFGTIVISTIVAFYAHAKFKKLNGNQEKPI